MNRPPIGQQEATTTTKKGEGLARLAAIADVVSRQRTSVPVPGPDASENAAGPPTRKRSIDSEDDNLGPSKKRFREEEIETDGNGKVIQFRQVSSTKCPSLSSRH